MKPRTSVYALLLCALAGAATAVEPPKRPEPIRQAAPPAAKPVVPLLRVPAPAPASIAVPNGSYLASCQNVRTEGDLVKASCTSRNGDRRDTSISVSGCAGSDIFNRNGFLMCATPVRARWGGSVLPPGSYLDSCFAAVNGTTLIGICLTGKGDVSVLGFEVVPKDDRVTRLDLSRCPDGSEIANLRGDLTCIAR